MPEVDDEAEEATETKFYLPREKGAIIVPFDDALPLMEQAAEILGDRFKEVRQGYLLDGKPANTSKVLKAAGLKFLDE